MDFIDEIRAFSKKIPGLTEKILTEEGTKNALIMPFIKILGYDVFNPNEVNPEYIADIPLKKGEKVDYALLKNGEPVILIECKSITSDLKKEHATQLYRYFTSTPAKIGVLTNGIVYQFYTDLDAKNKMDVKPFLEIDLLDIKEPLIAELKKFTKQEINLDELEDYASNLKYTREIIHIINKEFSNPSEEFVVFLARKVYSKMMTQQAKEKFTIITKESLNQFLSEKINERLKIAMEPQTSTPQNDDKAQTIQDEETNKVETTEEEYDGYYIIRAILTEVIDPSLVVMRDLQSYCGILYENNNRKPICRFYFDGKQKKIGVFDNEKREEIIIPISDLKDLFKLGDHFKKVVAMYAIK
ncbi:MAG: type I restriction endonuclease [Methanoregula sp.]|jgi:hypothetical protein|uniref:type I restriction endonuclease n=1 Tax=Methanoregula sp. TaxID=2052170 RepID=UPI0025DAD087|nr:type I restriction endonuclease [Methanoregula sp.]MCK9632064.1 type I restriction endonuclease [Methanoregula sp.]